MLNKVNLTRTKEKIKTNRIIVPLNIGEKFVMHVCKDRKKSKKFLKRNRALNWIYTSVYVYVLEKSI